MALVVNLFAGPGAGKSTTAALVFALLKQDGINVEIAHEYAKDLTWEDRHKAIRYQPYVTVKQMWRVHRLLDQVDVVITDSPILLSIVYGGEGYTDSFRNFVIDTYSRWNTLNYLLERGTYMYQTKGRQQTKYEALTLDTLIKEMLNTLEIPFEIIEGGGLAADTIYDHIVKCLKAS